MAIRSDFSLMPGLPESRSKKKRKFSGILGRLLSGDTDEKDLRIQILEQQLQTAREAQELRSRKSVGGLPPGRRKSFLAGEERKLGRPVRTEPVSNILTRGTDLGKHELLALGESAGDAPGQGLAEQEAFLGTPVGVGRSPQEEALASIQFGIPTEPGGIASGADEAGLLQLAQGQVLDPLKNEHTRALIAAAQERDPKVRENLKSVASALGNLRNVMGVIAKATSGQGVLDFTALRDPAKFRLAAPAIELYNSSVTELQRARLAAGLAPDQNLRYIIAKSVRRSDVPGEPSLGIEIVRQPSDPTQIGPADKMGILTFKDPDNPQPAGIFLDPAKVLERLGPTEPDAGVGEGPEAPPEILRAIQNMSLPDQDKEFLVALADTIAGELVSRLSEPDLDQNDIALRLTNLNVPVNDPRYQALTLRGKVAAATVIRQYFALIRDVHKVTLSDEIAGAGLPDEGVQGFGEALGDRELEISPRGGKGVREPVPKTGTAVPKQPVGLPEVGIAPGPRLPLGREELPGGLTGGRQQVPALVPPARAGAAAIPRTSQGLVKRTRPTVQRSDNPEVQDVVERAIGGEDVEDIESSLRALRPEELEEVKALLVEAKNRPFQRVEEALLAKLADVIDVIEDIQNEGLPTVRAR